MDYHDAAVTAPVNNQKDNGQEDIAAADGVLLDAAARLKELLAELAASLRPFPAFMNMVSLQAVELEPPFPGLEDRGCVVVLPDGNFANST